MGTCDRVGGCPAERCRGLWWPVSQRPHWGLISALLVATALLVVLATAAYVWWAVNRGYGGLAQTVSVDISPDRRLVAELEYVSGGDCGAMEVVVVEPLTMGCLLRERLWELAGARLADSGLQVISCKMTPPIEGALLGASRTTQLGRAGVYGQGEPGAPLIAIHWRDDEHLSVLAARSAVVERCRRWWQPTRVRALQVVVEQATGANAGSVVGVGLPGE